MEEKKRRIEKEEVRMKNELIRLGRPFIHIKSNGYIIIGALKETNG